MLHIHEPAVPGPSLTALFLAPAPMVGTFHAAGSQPAYSALAPLVRWAGAFLDARVAVSSDALDLVVPYIAGPWIELFNGIELGRFHEASPWPTDRPTVLFLGRHEPRKGLPVLLEALSHVSAPVTVWVAGDGESTAELRRRYTDPRIEWLGRISDAERDRRMLGADVFCAPSLGGESFGIILLEAMAAGTPVVASSIPGYVKVATAPAPDGSTPDHPAALLVEPDDPHALAEGLTRVLTDPAVGDALRERGRARAESFDMERLCDRYEEIYRRVTAERCANPATVSGSAVPDSANA